MTTLCMYFSYDMGRNDTGTVTYSTAGKSYVIRTLETYFITFKKRHTSNVWW